MRCWRSECSTLHSCLVTAAEALRRLPERDLIQMLYEISTFPEAMWLGTSDGNWVDVTAGSFFFLSSQCLQRCPLFTLKVYKLHLYANTARPTGRIHSLQLNKDCFHLSSQPPLWAIYAQPDQLLQKILNTALFRVHISLLIQCDGQTPFSCLKCFRWRVFDACPHNQHKAGTIWLFANSSPFFCLR